MARPTLPTAAFVVFMIALRVELVTAAPGEIELVTAAPGEINATLHRLGTGSDARCIDGSAAAYYFRAGTGSGASKWVVFHEGGGWCVSLADCRARAGKALGSSLNFTAELAMPDQLLSSNATINPPLHNWNVAYLPYCDGGSFVGDAVANDAQGTCPLSSIVATIHL